jgi:nucleotide-binding universal stress UspA family protein
MRIATVVVPLDGSEAAEQALPHAARIALAAGARMHLLGVIEHNQTGLTGQAGYIRAYLEQVARGTLELTLELAAVRLRRRGLRVTTEAVVGDPTQTIISAADGSDDVLLIMSTSGRGNAGPQHVGHVIGDVMQTLTHPVLFVGPRPAQAPGQGAQSGRLLVPLDGSAVAEAAIPPAEDIAQLLDAELVLVQVERPLTPEVLPSGFLPNASRLEADAIAGAARYLGDVSRRLAPGSPASTVVLRGSPSQALIDFCCGGIDMVVMSARGDGSRRRATPGHTTDRLVRSGVPILLVPPANVEPAANRPLVAIPAIR